MQVKSLVMMVKSEPTVQAGNIAFNLVQRKTLALSLNEPLQVRQPLSPSPSLHSFCLHCCIACATDDLRGAFDNR